MTRPVEVSVLTLLARAEPFALVEGDCKRLVTLASLTAPPKKYVVGASTLMVSSLTYSALSDFTSTWKSGLRYSATTNDTLQKTCCVFERGSPNCIFKL